MPKRIFRFGISNVVLKGKLFSHNFKSKLNCKTSAKFVWIDGSIKKDWRELKVKSGYRTDRLFLYYLLRLAKRDLLSTGNIKETDKIESHSKNDKLSIIYENSSIQSWRKCFTQHMEKEKKILRESVEKEIIEFETKKSLKSKVFSDSDSQTESKSGNECKSKKSDKVLLGQKVVSPENVINFGEKSENLGKRVSKAKELDEKMKVSSERKTTKRNRRSAEWKNKKYKSDKSNNDQSEKAKSCEICKLEHSGKCLLDGNYERHKDKIPDESFSSDYNPSPLTVNEQSMGDYIYSFDDSEREEFTEAKSLKQMGRSQKMTMSENNSLNGKSGNKLSNSSDKSNLGTSTFAKTTLPDFLFLKMTDPSHGLGVFTKVFIEKGTQFGPLIGQGLKEKDIGDEVNMRDIWEVHLVEGVTYVSTQDDESSNWLKFIRPADNRESANLVTTAKDDCLYFDSIRDIRQGEEFVYWISDSQFSWSRKKSEKKNCGGCNLQFSHVLYYRKHCMIFHDPNISLTTRKYYCKVCGLAVLGKEKIIKHAVEMHHGKGAYQCQFCHKFFLRLNYLEMHRTYGCAENPQRSRPLCDLCGRKFCQPQKLKAHIRRMHSDMAVVLRDFQCKNCQKILGSRAALQRHLKEVHNKGVVGAFTCDRCGKIFQNKSNLKIHMLTHSGVKPFKCQEVDCSAAFTTKQCLKFHYKKVHGFSDEVIPKIERSVAYTFDAYSGGAVSDPDQDSSLHLENSQYSVLQETNEGVDLTLGIPAPQESPSEKRFSPLLPEDPSLIIHLDEKYICSKSSKELMRKDSPKSPSSRGEEIYDEPKLSKTANKKLWAVHSISDKIDLSQPVFKDNPNTSLLVEAAIDAAEKDLMEKSSRGSCRSVVEDEEVMESQPEMYSFAQYDSNPADMICEANFKKPQICEKPSPECQKLNCCQDSEYKGNFLLREKSNLSEMFKFNSLLRINTSPFSEMQKDCGLVVSERDQDGGDSLTEDEMDNSRGRDLPDMSPKKDISPEKYRNVECDLRLGMKFDYGDVDFTEYRSLEKTRNLDLGIQRLTDERMMEAERENGAENLCLKEKSYQCENLEELAKLGRESSGFENVFGNDTAAQNQNFGALFRSPHGIVSPRSYHPAAFESESVDLSIRPPFSSSPVYTLDLTPSRVDLPSRHLDFRTHLGLPPLRFGSSTDGESPQMSSPGYSIYQSAYGVPAHRSCQSSQFQPYTPLYY